ncbi:MAG: hypothetical protein WCI72_02510 [archaeon]
MAKNFVSVSGISDISQLREIRDICLEEKIAFPVAIGYQLSNMSINQGTQNPRQPLFTDLPRLDEQTREYGFTTALHYYTRDNGTILDDMKKIVDCGIRPTLLQFNSLPPSLDILKQVKEMGFQILLKVAVSNKSSAEGGYKVWKGEGVEDVSTGNVNPLFNQIYERRNFIDYAMFDASHGNNLELDLSQESLAIIFGKMITRNAELNNLGLMYAGGIKPSNVQRVTQQLQGYFPERFSIDTEGGVRVNDKLDLQLVRDYLVGYRDTIKKQ